MIIDKIDSTLQQLAISQENTIFSYAFKNVNICYFRDVTNELLQKIEAENYPLLNNFIAFLFSRRESTHAFSNNKYGRRSIVLIV